MFVAVLKREVDPFFHVISETIGNLTKLVKQWIILGKKLHIKRVRLFRLVGTLWFILGGQIWYDYSLFQRVTPNTEQLSCSRNNSQRNIVLFRSYIEVCI